MSEIPNIHLDEITAEREGRAFLRKVSEEFPDKAMLELQIHNLAKGHTITLGKTMSLWYRDKVVAVVNLLRTQFNYTQLVCHRLDIIPDDLPQPGQIDDNGQ